jgi:hypothetical protein
MGSLGPAVALAAAAVFMAVAVGSAWVLKRAPGGENAHFALILLGSFSASVVTLVGLLIVWSRDRNLRIRREGSLYGLTDRRAMVWAPDPDTGLVRVVAFPFHRIVGVDRAERPDGSGDVCFRFDQGDLLDPDEPTGFEAVADVRGVEEQVRKTLADHAGRGNEGTTG